MREDLDIRYIKLHFVLQLLEDSVLPPYKESALRGGMGEMMLRANCIRDRNCPDCDFSEECIVQRTLYSRFEKKPDFVTSGESIGYVIECGDHRERFAAGSTLKFNLILFGRAIVYFNQYLMALASLGQVGLGKYKTRFCIAEILNAKKQPVLRGSDILMQYYQVDKISNYVLRRKSQLGGETDSSTWKMDFLSPLTLKFHWEFMQELQIEAIVKAVQRRIYLLDCYENLDMEEAYKQEYRLPQTFDAHSHMVKVRRYSNRREMAMSLTGIQGSLKLEGVDESLLDILLAGELIHIGKNTSFGFGKYRITKA